MDLKTKKNVRRPGRKKGRKTQLYRQHAHKCANQRGCIYTCESYVTLGTVSRGRMLRRIVKQRCFESIVMHGCIRTWLHFRDTLFYRLCFCPSPALFGTKLKLSFFLSPFSSLIYAHDLLVHTQTLPCPDYFHPRALFHSLLCPRSLMKGRLLFLFSTQEVANSAPSWKHLPRLTGWFRIENCVFTTAMSQTLLI